MLTLILCGLVGSAVSYLLTRKTVDKAGMFLLMILAFAVGLIVGCLLVFVLRGEGKTIEYESTTKTKIVSLVDESRIFGKLSGGFFVITGSLGSEEYYKFYVETPDGGKQFRSLPARKVVIYKENTKNAYISELMKKVVYPIRTRNRLFIPEFFVNIPGSPTGRYAIHVPSGTIRVEENFHLDMK